MRKNYVISIKAFLVFLISGISLAQNKTTIPDLSKIVNEDGWRLFNRKAEIISENGTVAVNFNSQPGDGFARLTDFEFNNGTIEVDIKGKDVQQGSFIGIAFRGLNDSTYDAVYFRPFNFLSADLARKSHSVQYISQPIYTWSKLRKEFPGKYENAIEPSPNPNEFFHAKVVIEKTSIKVFVNGLEQPSLIVNELSDRNGGWVGLWVGNYSDGTFTNLKITKEN